MKTSLPSKISLALLLSVIFTGCTESEEPASQSKTVEESTPAAIANETQTKTNPRFDIYQEVKLSADLSHLSDNQRKMIAILIDASKIMDDLYWKQAYGDKESFLKSIEDPKTRRFADINYGPWDRLDGDKPFISTSSEKPLGAQYYPSDMTKEEFAAANLENGKGLYTIVKRDDKGALYTVPFHKMYATELAKAAALLEQASQLADDSQFKSYLSMRAKAITTDDFQPSDLAWMDMKTNPVELVIGPIETYEDLLFGYKTAYEAYVLIKDLAWSEKLSRFAAYLPKLQKGLPVDEKYKQETPGTDSDLNAYDVVYYAGHSNAGSKTIAINLPNDEAVQLAKGTRRLQLKNAMKAKFEPYSCPNCRAINCARPASIYYF